MINGFCMYILVPSSHTLYLFSLVTRCVVTIHYTFFLLHGCLTAQSRRALPMSKCRSIYIEVQLFSPLSSPYPAHTSLSLGILLSGILYLFLSAGHRPGHDVLTVTVPQVRLFERSLSVPYNFIYDQIGLLTTQRTRSSSHPILHSSSQICDRLCRHGVLITKTTIKNWSQDRHLHACTPTGNKHVKHGDRLKYRYCGENSETDTKASRSGLT